jgi:transposase
MDQFYAHLGQENAAQIRLAVMDMWKPFRLSTQAHAPQAAILFDKFHVLRHLGEALDKIRKAEYARVAGPKRKFIKGQKYVLLSHRENLTREGKQNLKLLLQVNKRLNTAYILRDSFGQLLDYKSATWARRFFDAWKSQLRWQRLEPYERFAEMVERHWDGIAAYCKPENKVALGFVEGMNNKIRVIQRRSYGLRDEEYLRLKVLTTNLPDLWKTEEITHRRARHSGTKRATRSIGNLPDQMLPPSLNVGVRQVLACAKEARCREGRHNGKRISEC